MADREQQLAQTLGLIEALGRDGLETPQELALRARTALRVSRWYRCGEGHVFEWGTEDWHAAASQPNGAPSHCPVQMENGESCAESGELFGPFQTETEALPLPSAESRSQLRALAHARGVCMICGQEVT